MKKITDDVFYTEDKLLSLSRSELSFLSERALVSSRLRCRLCGHLSPDDVLHEMFIALAYDSYIQPHRHHLKSESLHVIDGEADLVIFDEFGGIKDVVGLGDCKTGRSFFFRVGEPIFHSLVVRSKTFLFHETTIGPFRREDTEYASWSPGELTPDSLSYLTKLREEISSRS